LVPRQHSTGGKAWLLGISKLGNAYLRDHRPDCKQVNIALVVGRSGLPLGYEVFAGIRSDVTTVKEIVEAMESKYGQANRIWVMDRGMVSADNVEFLQQGRRRYILGTPKSMLRKFEQQLLDSNWREVHQGSRSSSVRLQAGKKSSFFAAVPSAS
jgi:transposase